MTTLITTNPIAMWIARETFRNVKKEEIPKENMQVGHSNAIIHFKW
jgi:hypothetical protein